MNWREHFVGAHHGGSGMVSGPQTRGIVIASGWRYDVMMWIGNVASHGEWQAIRQKTIDLAQLQPGEAMLDVGCGTGTMALLAKRQVGDTGRVCGIDPSPGMIARAMHKASRHSLAIEFQTGVIERLAFPDQTFDAVLSTFMMHQIPDDVKRQGLAEIARVLKPGGRLLVVDTRRSEVSHQASTRTAHPEHTGVWNSGIQDQPALMQAAGFSQIESETLEIRATGLPEVGYARGIMRS